MDALGTLEGRQDYTIHGQLYARLFFTLDGNGDAVIQAQLPSDAFDADLQVGDRVRVTMLLRTIMEIRKYTDA